MKKLHVKVGDEITVLAGKSKGQSGNIKAINRKKERVIIEGLNLCKKTVKPSEEYPEGGFIDIEAPIHISNVMLKKRYDEKKNKKV